LNKWSAKVNNIHSQHGKLSAFALSLKRGYNFRDGREKVFSVFGLVTTLFFQPVASEFEYRPRKKRREEGQNEIQLKIRELKRERLKRRGGE
jgi:hypothetical protein